MLHFNFFSIINLNFFLSTPSNLTVFFMEFPTPNLTNTEMIVPLLNFSFLLFLFGVFGLLFNFKNFLISMMAIELMYLGVILSFSFGSLVTPMISMYALNVIILAACESAVGLGILIVLYRFNQSVDLEYYTELKTPNYMKLPQFNIAVVVGSIVLDTYKETQATLLTYIILAMIICGILAILVYLLSLTTTRDTEKLSEYECGFAPFDSATRRPFDVHFYLVGILFLIFDVEVALLFPWTAYAATMNEFSYYLMFTFLIILGFGFIYEWTCGALKWPTKQFQKLEH